MTEAIETAAAVEFDNVSIVFGDNPESALPLMDAGQSRAEIQQETQQVLGVHNCSLSVQPGEILVLMGLSGSGKSTLLRAVNGLNPVVRGSVRVHSEGWTCDPTSCPADELLRLRRECVAMVFQQFGLLPWRNVVDNVALGLELSGMGRIQREERVREQLDLVGLSDWAENKVSELSGGMQQRVGLARAFATHAPILLMDEPFSALDPLIRARLQDELLELQEKLQRTIIFVSHDLDEAFKLGNRIAIMEGGRIVQCGTPQEIIANPVNDYVEDFVAHMNPLNVLQASDVMSAELVASTAFTVREDAPIADVIDALSAGAAVVAVLDENGAPVGSISGQMIIEALQKAPAREPALEPGAASV
ncbi:choline ABC transporter ATP-binding protein [Breoghania sp. L-A4]|uniref:choline ABC transporter ATP-binding protein n=1 Tax=Breoghania sp. L-A4 TaxID=2304600 RepID=UPI000E35BB44|nr:choline ABC transporter ATP-binding protein [Breoghania sp. L-A4]AXS42201.1 choline ABC transporter ATP-binding protein [Breoghania sp. L-A4]